MTTSIKVEIEYFTRVLKLVNLKFPDVIASEAFAEWTSKGSVYFELYLSNIADDGENQGNLIAHIARGPAFNSLVWPGQATAEYYPSAGQVHVVWSPSGGLY